MSRIFISYGHEDLVTALELYDSLSSAGHTPWLDKRDLLPGERWSDRISEEIQKADFFILLLSRQSFIRRGFLQKELHLALEVLEQVPLDQRFLIPVLLDDFKPSHAALRQLHWFDLTQDRSNRLAFLVSSLGSRESATAQLLAENPKPAAVSPKRKKKRKSRRSTTVADIGEPHWGSATWIPH